MQIVDLRLAEVEQRLATKKIRLNVDKEAKQYLGSIGYSATYGARPLNRTIQQELLNPLALLILEERIRDNEVVQVRFDGPRNRLFIVPNHEGVPRDEADGDMDMVDDYEVEEMD